MNIANHTVKIRAVPLKDFHPPGGDKEGLPDPMWVVEVQTGLMPAPGFYYYQELEEARTFARRSI